jgi:serine/threonine protein kinase
MDLLRRLLSFSPEQRITVEEALTHPYVAAFHNAKNETTLPHPIKVQINDNHKLTIKDYRDALYQCIQKAQTPIALPQRKQPPGALEEATETMKVNNYMSKPTSTTTSTSKSNLVVVPQRKPSSMT